MLQKRERDKENIVLQPSFANLMRNFISLTEGMVTEYYIKRKMFK